MDMYSIDGKHLSEFGDIEMTGKDIPVSPPFSNNEEKQAGIDGGWDFGIEYEPKIITVDHYVLANTKQARKDLERKMAGFLNPRRGKRTIVFDDEPDKCYFGRLSEQFKLDELMNNFSDFTLNFICYDPFTYSVQEYERTIQTEGTIDHLGEHVAQPILIVRHKGGTGSIVNTQPDGTTQTVEFNDRTMAGTYYIDMKEKTVKMADGTSGDKYIESLSWFEMPNGTNTITHGINIENVIVRYRNTWL